MVKDVLDRRFSSLLKYQYMWEDLFFFLIVRILIGDYIYSIDSYKFVQVIKMWRIRAICLNPRDG